jgi:triphosphoribosyl-dephospho-CoA synthase
VTASALAFLAACRDEIAAPKPGNVHTYADGHGMTVEDFLRSAEAAAPGLCAHGAPIGSRILTAIEATRAAVGQNTNLGIVLLCAPLAAAAEARAISSEPDPGSRREIAINQECRAGFRLDPNESRSGGDLRGAVLDVLAGLTRADAALAFRAILLAQPAGLGESPRHDVHAPAEATLLEAMREAADRDRIAFQYATGFQDVFETGFEAIEDLRRKGHGAPWPAVGVHLGFLASFPDSHIVRKKGAEAAARVRDEARRLHRDFMQASDPASMLPALLAFDRELKSRGTNPGTSADLTVATLFADRLKRGLIA